MTKEETTPQEQFMLSMIEKSEKKEHLLLPTQVYVHLMEYIGDRPNKEVGTLSISLQANVLPLARYFELAYPEEGKVVLKAVKKDLPKKKAGVKKAAIKNKIAAIKKKVATKKKK